MASGTEPVYLLVKDKGFDCCCGQLVHSIGNGRYKIPHSTGYSPTATLDPDDMVTLTVEEYHILNAIHPAVNRYIAYSTPGKLAWGLKLKVGDTVMAKLPHRDRRGSSGGTEQQDVCTTAIIRWCGEEYEKYLFGVEISEARHYGQGDTDGTQHKGTQWVRQYFSCPPNCGLFLSLADIEQLEATAADLQERVSELERQLRARVLEAGELASSKLGITMRNDTISRLFDEVREMTRKVREKDDIVTRLEGEVREKTREVREKEGTISKLQGTVRETFTIITRLEEEVREKEARLQGKVQEKARVVREKGTITKLQGEVSETREVREKEAIIRRLQSEVREKERLHRGAMSRLQMEGREHETALSGLRDQLRAQGERHAAELQQVREEAEQYQQQWRDQQAQHQQLTTRINAAMANLRGEATPPQQALQLWELPREEVHISQTILGTGGWGYVAKGIFQGQAVAVKCLHRGILSPQNEGRVRREINIMAQVRHPNLLLLIGAVLTIEGAGPLIVTELLDRSLRSAYESGSLKERSKLPVLRDVASALTYLHSHRTPIIHRDVSSANVLLDPIRDTWRAKLSDFGSANLSHLATTPAEGAAVYAAPEVSTEDRSRQTPKIDVYSFGVLACEVCLCRFPPERREFPSMLREVQGTAPNMFPLARNCTSHTHHNRPGMRDVLQCLDELANP